MKKKMAENVTKNVAATTEAGAAAEIFATPAAPIPFTDEDDDFDETDDIDFNVETYMRGHTDGFNAGVAKAMEDHAELEDFLYNAGKLDGLSEANAEQYDIGFRDALAEHERLCKVAYDNGFKAAVAEVEKNRKQIFADGENYGYHAGFADALERCIEILADKLLSA